MVFSAKRVINERTGTALDTLGRSCHSYGDRFAAALVPALLIQPFKLQTAGRLNISFGLRHWSPIITVAHCRSQVLIAVSLWKQAHRWWRKGLFLPSPLLAAIWFARQNHFEWDVQAPSERLLRQGERCRVCLDGDMVLAVELNGDAAAYPIRQIAYHHVVQDTIGGIPVLVTY
jgi:hypothetical protein